MSDPVPSFAERRANIHLLPDLPDLPDIPVTPVTPVIPER
jgi:hypothetical protein